MSAYNKDRFPPGFKEPVFQSQAAFRHILDAMAYPGRVQTFEDSPGTPAGLCPGTAAVCLTLIDFETPLWLDEAAATSESVAYLRFHCGAPLVGETHSARFALVADPARMPRLAAFSVGEDEYPDRSTTLILQVSSLTSGAKKIWSGPGIAGRIETSVGDLPQWFWQDWALNSDIYPLGVDIVFVSHRAIVGLPRSIKCED